MRKQFLALLLGALVVVLCVGVGASTAGSGPAPKAGEQTPRGADSLPNPLAEKQAALRATALAMQAKGQIPQGAKVGQVAARGSTSSSHARVRTRSSRSSASSGIRSTRRTAARRARCTTRSRSPTARSTTRPSGRRTSTRATTRTCCSRRSPASARCGTSTSRTRPAATPSTARSTDWVQVPFNEAATARTTAAASSAPARGCSSADDGLNAWYDDADRRRQDRRRRSTTYLAQFDVWDRYDYDDDGNFNEPDGYIDHFQAIHAGEGEETGGGAQGTDAIWSHRWYANVRQHRPRRSAPINKLGGVRIGGSNFWIGDYTIEPENGGVGVFAHEFGHDLGLPDEYDTSRQHRRRRELDRLLDALVEGSYGSDGDARRRDRQPAVLDERVGQAPSSAGSTTRSSIPGDGKTKITLGPAEAQHEAGSRPRSSSLPDKYGDHEHRRAVRRLEVLLLGCRQQPRQRRWRGR